MFPEAVAKREAAYERGRQMLRGVRAGVPVPDLARRFGMSRTRAYQILHKAEKNREAPVAQYFRQTWADYEQLCSRRPTAPEKPRRPRPKPPRTDWYRMEDQRQGEALTALIIQKLSPVLDGEPLPLVIEAVAAAMMALLASSVPFPAQKRTVLLSYAQRILNYAEEVT
jgi:hypothetical protein